MIFAAGRVIVDQANECDVARERRGVDIADLRQRLAVELVPNDRTDSGRRVIAPLPRAQLHFLEPCLDGPRDILSLNQHRAGQCKRFSFRVEILRGPSNFGEERQRLFEVVERRMVHGHEQLGSFGQRRRGKFAQQEIQRCQRLVVLLRALIGRGHQEIGLVEMRRAG